MSKTLTFAPDVGILTENPWSCGPIDVPAMREPMVDWARRHRLVLAREPMPWGDPLEVHLDHGGWLDHPTHWARNGRPAVFVSQPYPDNLRGGGPEDVRAYAERRGCRWTVVRDGGWYGHGTVFVAVWDPAVIDEVTP